MNSTIDYLINYHKGKKITTYGNGKLTMHDNVKNDLADMTVTALTVLQKMASGEDWFQIENAPKDGTSVILHRKSKIKELTHSFSALFEDDKWKVIEGLEFNKPTHWRHIDQSKHIQMMMEKELNR